MRIIIKNFCITFLWVYFAGYGLMWFIVNMIHKYELLPVIAKTIIYFKNLF